MHQIALGYFRVPSRGDQPLEVVVNPQGLRARSEVRTSEPALLMLQHVVCLLHVPALSDRADCWVCAATLPLWPPPPPLTLPQMAVWNRGDGRCKLVTLASLKTVRSARPGSHSGTDSSDGGHGRGGSSGRGSDHSSDMDEARSAGVAVAEAAAPGQTAEDGSLVRW